MARKTTLGPMSTPGRSYIFTPKIAVTRVSEVWKAIHAAGNTWKFVNAPGNIWKIIK